MEVARYSSHKICFICQRPAKYTKLSKVSKATIASAFQDHNIILKENSRCCREHLDKTSSCLKQGAYDVMPTTKINSDIHLLPVLKAVANNAKESSSLRRGRFLFEQFDDLESLDEMLCIKITGWTKDEFTRFCDFITSINRSSNRSKQQLVAFYRFWLRKGPCQQTLAYMFSETTTQQQISHYLSQIRTAIYKDFVPFYLGSHFGREKFIEHNSEMFAQLHDMSDTDLAIVVDGTYTRCEKSADNQFQYNSYSEQKKDSLVKPFLVCTGDGYIIDCYGPFQANYNDAKIFKYILENDDDLLRHLQSSKTFVFMDRGKHR